MHVLRLLLLRLLLLLLLLLVLLLLLLVVMMMVVWRLGMMLEVMIDIGAGGAGIHSRAPPRGGGKRSLTIYFWSLGRRMR